RLAGSQIPQQPLYQAAVRGIPRRTERPSGPRTAAHHLREKKPVLTLPGQTGLLQGFHAVVFKLQNVRLAPTSSETETEGSACVRIVKFPSSPTPKSGTAWRPPRR